MRTKIATLAATSVLLALPAAPAQAGGKDPVMGVPGTPGCQGQNVAYLARWYADYDIHGIGGLAKAKRTTADRMVDNARRWCDG